LHTELESIYKKARKSFLIRVSVHIKFGEGYHTISLQSYQGIYNLKIRLFEFNHTYTYLELAFLNLFSDFKIEQDIFDEKTLTILEVQEGSDLFEKYIKVLRDLKYNKYCLTQDLQANKDRFLSSKKNINKILKLLGE